MDWDIGFSTNSPEFLQVDDAEMEEFRSEKTVTGCKSPEEIEELTVDESLSPIERACLLLSTGQEVQKIHAIEQLPYLIERFQDQALSKVLPKICDSLPSSSSPEIQDVAAHSFSSVASRDLVPQHIFTTSFLPTTLKMVNCRDSAVSSVWVDALLAAIPLLPKDIIKRDILSLAVSRSHLSQSVTSRKSSCLIIGKMASKFEPFWLKRELLPLASSLCQDVDNEVRATMCTQLTPLAKAIGKEMTINSVLSELTELVKDEEEHVRDVAMETVTDMISLLPSDVVTSSIVPLVRSVCGGVVKGEGGEGVRGEGGNLRGVAKLLGRLSFELREVMTKELRDWFVQLFCTLTSYEAPSNESSASVSSVSVAMSTGGDTVETDCHQLCAYNLPAMVLLTGPSSFEPSLSIALTQLASDESPRVRATVAVGYHEVVRILGKKSLTVSSSYHSLLRDQTPEVICCLATHLPQTMKSFADASNLAEDTKHPGLTDFISPLLCAESTVCTGLQWRGHEQIITGFSSLIHCLTTDQLYNRFTPLLFKHITGNCVRPVKLAACRTLVTFIRHCRRAELRKNLCARIIQECALSNSCRNRLIFLDICDIILTVFSRAFFKEHFFKAILDLGNDPVINIRLRFCSFLPSLKAVLKLPSDRVLLQELEQTVRHLLSRERDVDTVRAVHHAVMELDRIQVAMESLTRKTFFEADLIDQQKEEEERKLEEAEEREGEKEKEKESSNGGRKNVSLGTSKNSPLPQKAMFGKKAPRAATLPGRSPTSTRKACPTVSLPPLAGPIVAMGTHSPSTQRKGSLPSSKLRGSTTSHLAVTRSESVPIPPVREEEGEEGRKVTSAAARGFSSPHPARPTRRGSSGATKSANNSPNTTSKLTITKSRPPGRKVDSASKRKGPTISTSLKRK